MRIYSLSESSCEWSIVLQPLNFPQIDFLFREQEEQKQIFDIVRQKYIALTPEEWVRQHWIHFLIHARSVPQGLMAVETVLRVHGFSKRCDILVHDRKIQPVMVIECKAPQVKLDRDTAWQIALYNMKLRAPYLVISNGLQHFVCQIDYEKSKTVFLNRIPDYAELTA
jgi:hypothetical protein